MMSDAFLPANELPEGFSYPGAFRRLVERGLVYFEPWFVLEDEQLRARARGIRDRYPERQLVPFARREDNDDVACWENGHGTEVQIIHDFASPGWEQRRTLNSLADWVRLAVEDMLAFDAGQEEESEATSG